ncbi:hypothetical protein [Williamsia deligens]|uniref:DNA topoisomerase (ATP-hydrolyzing) n=1 Tax=Williamsia deligens TaxID=321325 RepID=A0ABW3GAT9_9NOCA|nr:hypothetical protein [Williamsia deligens]
MVRIENEMHLLDGDIQLAWLGAQFSPFELLGRDSLLRKLSTGLTPDGPAIGVEVGGRSAWSVRLRTSNDEAIDLAFDDATGVLLQVANSDGYVLLRVDDLSEPESLSDSLFRWDGPVREAQRGRSGRARNGVGEAERLEFLRVLIAAQEMPQEVLAAIGTADTDAAARDALVQLLGVTESWAEAIMATPIGQFRPDHLAANRRSLRELEERHRG